MHNRNRIFTAHTKLASGFHLDEGNGPTVLVPRRWPMSWGIGGILIPFAIVAILVALGRVSFSDRSGRDATFVAGVCAVCIALVGWGINRHSRKIGPLLVIDHAAKRVRLPRHGVEFPFVSVEAVHLLEGHWRNRREVESCIELSLLIRDRDGRSGRWPLFMTGTQLIRDPTYELARRLGDELGVSVISDVADEPQ